MKIVSFNVNGIRAILNKTFVGLTVLTMWIGVTELLVTISISRTTETTLINDLSLNILSNSSFLHTL